MRSMTGFGKMEATAPDGAVFTAELSSVNRKQLELRINLPAEFTALEPTARKILSGAISRGAVSLRVSRSAGAGSAAPARINRTFLRQLAEECLALQRELGPGLHCDAAALLSVPGVLEVSGGDAESPEQSAAFEAALRGAVNNFIAMREAEGVALRADLEERLAKLRDLLERIRPSAESIAASLRARLLEKLANDNLLPDPNDERVLREVLFYADRADVAEELTRLDSHFVQFEKFLANHGEPIGRSLDFLVQEMFREITTLSNKAGTCDISPLAVAFKSELEKIREQVQNVE